MHRPFGNVEADLGAEIMVSEDQQIWVALSAYESTDIVSDLYRVTQGRELSTTWAREIASSFSQGREYFEAASASGPLVRPVLQYYGVVALSRALIQFAQRNVGGADLPRSHGIVAELWDETLKDPKSSLDIALKVTNGTFSALAKATANKDVFTVEQRFGLSRQHTLKWPTDGWEGATFTLGQVLARIADLTQVYLRSTKRFPLAFPATLTATPQDNVWLGVVNMHPDITGSYLRHELGIHDALKDSLATLALNRPNGIYQHSFYATYTNDWAQLLPQLESLPDGSLAVSAAFPNGIRLSRLMRLFLMSAFLGFYCRYYPSPWLIAIQGRAQGDFIMPLVRAAMDLIDGCFPSLILGELEGRLAAVQGKDSDSP